MNALAQQDFYLNSNQYTDLKRDVRANNEAANKTALQQFESLYITQMIKEMRAAAVVDKDQHSSYMDFYTDMYDKQLATIMAKQGGIGIAKQLQQQLDLDANADYKKDYKGGKFFPLHPPVAADKNMALNINPEGMALNRTSEAKAQVVELKLPFNLKENTLESYHVSETLPPLAMNSQVRVIAIDSLAQLQQTALPEEFHQIQNNVDNSVVNIRAIDPNKVTNTALVDEKIHAHKGWSQPSQFVQELMPHAQAVANQLGIKPEVIVAQSVLETGWGKHTMRHNDGSVSFSLFGIKADHRWSGDTVQVSTLEFKDGHMQKETAQFRAYDSVGEAIQDYVHFIKNNARYKNALNNNGDDIHYVKGLQKAGYATDPAYAKKILNILHSDTLKQSLATIETTREVA